MKNRAFEDFLTSCRRHGSEEEADSMSAYMKNKFPFFGIKSPLRKHLFADFLAEFGKPDRELLRMTVSRFWDAPEREMQYCGQELLHKYRKLLKAEDLPFIRGLITAKSWWDTVDFLSDHMMGWYFLTWPEKRNELILTWAEEEDFWLRRSAILFQLKYREATDFGLLQEVILRNCADTEFFIRKAIGWSLREYAKTRPGAVKKFVAQHREKLSPLSIREALKHL